jgi:hypothetical protein
MASLSAAVQVAIAGIFLVSGLQKAPRTNRLALTVQRLGVARALSSVAAVVVIAAELVIATSLMLVPSAAWPRVATILMATTFAGAGLIALSRRQGVRIACNCFGGGDSKALGYRQLQMLPLWIVAVLVAGWAAPTWSVEFGIGVLTVAVLTLACLQAAQVVVKGLRLREDRLVVTLPLAETVAAVKERSEARS